MRFVWILLGLIFFVVFIACGIILIVGSPFAMMAGEWTSLIVFGVIGLLSLAAGIYFIQKQ
jgi:hypothetical protein